MSLPSQQLGTLRPRHHTATGSLGRSEIAGQTDVAYRLTIARYEPVFLGYYRRFRSNVMLRYRGQHNEISKTQHPNHLGSKIARTFHDVNSC